MEIKITGKNFEVTPAIKDYVSKRLNTHIDKVLLKPTKADVVLTVNKKYQHIAEVTIHTVHQTLHSSAQSEDMYSSIDFVVDKIARQAQRIKEKMTAHNGIDKRSRMKISNTPTRKSRVVLKNDKVAVKPMSVDEAILQLEALNYNFLVFRNAQTDDIEIVYKRDDSTYGLISNLK